MTDQDLSAAIVVFLGHGVHSSPRAQRDVVAALFGADAVAPVEAIVREMTRIDVDWERSDLPDGGTVAREEMARRHPELDAAALDALRWYYTFSWR